MIILLMFDAISHVPEMCKINNNDNLDFTKNINLFFYKGREFG